MIDLDELRETAGPTGFWYLATPYSRYPGGTHDAFIHACFAAGWLIRNRVPVFSPIAHSHPIAFHGCVDPLCHDIWLPADAPFMAASVGIVVCQMPGWQESFGVQKELEYFREVAKPIHYLPWPIQEK